MDWEVPLEAGIEFALAAAEVAAVAPETVREVTIIPTALQPSSNPRVQRSKGLLKAMMDMKVRKSYHRVLIVLDL